jgi:hypothetical protein
MMKHAEGRSAAAARQVAAAAMPTSSVDTKYWYRQKNLRKLNLLIIVPLVSIFTLG